MRYKDKKLYSVIVAGVGGQGSITVAHLLLGAAWKAGFSTMQSEVHGMSQRGGAVNAHVLFSEIPVTSPLITEGTADVLVGLEPLETMRYIEYLRSDGTIISSTTPVKNMPVYPEETELFSALKDQGAVLIDTDASAKELNFKQAGNMVILGRVSKDLPFTQELWLSVISERFMSKGDEIIEKNVHAFEFGRKIQ